ncbi:MAG: hypothetical protein EVB11_07790 [Winogradskyella sp.]|nr:MAG: hypothetical protein EVB11_07790 [Winogradskyella sp.]
MKKKLQTSKALNVFALFCLLGGGYGLMFTGFFQVIAGVYFAFAFPKSKRIQLYFLLVALFFLVWKGNIFGWQFLLPMGLILFLTYTIHTKKL